MHKSLSYNDNDWPSCGSHYPASGYKKNFLCIK